MRLMVKNVVLIGCLIFVSACGKKVNSMKNSPFEANNLAVAFPKPDEAPVMKIVLFIFLIFKIDTAKMHL